MQGIRYLIVGGGMCGHAAAQAVRELDPDGRVTILSADPERPYARPPLSKGLWLGKAEETVWLPEFPGVELLRGRVAVALDLAGREVRDELGGVHPYDRLLLATGGEPRRLPVGGDLIIYYRTLADFRRLRAVAGKNVVVVGGGFIGSEIASALAQNGRTVTMIFPEDLVGSRAYPKDLAAAVTRTFLEKGVRLRSRETVSAVEESGGRLMVLTTNGEEIAADAVVAGLGIGPATALAEAAGIRCGNGIEVDDRLRTSAPGVYAAGDVARFPCRALEERIRVEHEDAAITMGRAAGRNMAGADEPYQHLPFFYSDLFDLGYEAVGRLDARLETVSTWKTPFREGVVYFLERGRVRGVLLWGVFGQVEAARRMVSASAAPRREALRDAIHA